MFEKLFVKYRAITRHKNDPLVKERLEYLEHCAALGMSVRSLKEIATYLLIVVEFLHLDATVNDEISVDEIQKQAEQWVNREPQPTNLKSQAGSKRRFTKHATRWLQFMGRLLAPVKNIPPYESYLMQFVEFMKTEKELSLASIDVRYRAVRDFLEQLYKNGHVLKTITITHIDEVFVRKTFEKNYATTTLQGYACNLRGFVRFAESRGWCVAGLAGMIETPRVYKHSNIPSGPSWADVQKLIASTEGYKPTDIRDRAILMLFSVYGFRSSEVAILSLDDLDWEKELIHIYRPKQRKKQTYPLAHSVGESILCYLKNARPQTSRRELFLLRRAPFTPLSNSTLYAIVSRRLKSLNIESSHFGAHAIRHACATRLLQQEHSLKEIGDYLGHKDPEATRVYAKVDINGLRQVGNFDLGDIL